MSRKSRWALRPSDLPPARARRAAVELEGMAENPLFRRLHLQRRTGQLGLMGGSGLTHGLRPNAGLGFQLVHDLWMAGMQPIEIAGAIWGYHAAARFRNWLLGFAGLLVCATIAGIGGLLGGLFTPQHGSSALIAALAAVCLQGGLYAHHWLALSATDTALKEEQERWEGRLPRSKRLPSEPNELLGCCVAAFAGLFLAGSVGTIFGALFQGDRFAYAVLEALKPAWRFALACGEAVPLGARRIFWGAVVGTCVAQTARIAARRLARRSFARCVRRVENIFHYRLALEESKPAAAPPGK